MTINEENHNIHKRITFFVDKYLNIYNYSLSALDNYLKTYSEYISLSKEFKVKIKSEYNVFPSYDLVLSKISRVNTIFESLNKAINNRDILIDDTYCLKCVNLNNKELLLSIIEENKFLFEYDFEFPNSTLILIYIENMAKEYLNIPIEIDLLSMINKVVSKLSDKK